MELKFKIWDKKGKCFLTTFSFNSFNNNVHANEDIRKIFQLNDIEWVQFTGFQDRNDQDIYVGDILLYKYGIDKDVFTVTLDRGVFGFDGDYDSMIEFCATKEDTKLLHAKIIGNVYENPNFFD